MISHLHATVNPGQSVGVLAGATRPWAKHVGEVGLDADGGSELRVRGESLALPGQRSAQLFGELGHRRCERVVHGGVAAAGRDGPLLGATDDAVAVRAR